MEYLPDGTTRDPIIDSYTPRGRAYLEALEERQSEKKDNIRYWITIGIAVLALIFSAFPEFRDTCVGLFKSLFR